MNASLLKDKGAAYRHTQSFKLQLVILKQLSRIISDIDMADSHINTTFEAVLPYLSNKQPLPLQV